MRTRYRGFAVALAVVGVVLAGCGSETPTATELGKNPTNESFQLVAYQSEDGLSGRELEFASLVGQGTPIVVNFWAAQCPPCRLEMPWFETTSRQYEGEVAMVGIDVGPFVGLGSNEQGAQLLRELGITYPTAYAVDDTPVRRFDVLGMPTTLSFDAQGNLIDNHAGILTLDEIEDWFHRLAAEPAA